jgi:PAS domain S-box-containing protein
MTSRSRTFAVFMTTAIVVVACIVAIYLIGVATIRANAAVQRHRIVAEHLQQFLSTLKDAETGQRGFVVTGKPSYLTPYNEAKSRIDQESQELAHNVQRGELSADDVNRLKKLTSQKMSELQETIDLRNSRGFEPAEALIASDRGKRTMDAIRSLLGTMTEREDAALEGSRRRADLFVESSALIVAISALLSLAVLAWGYQQIKQESRAREAGAVELLRQRNLLEVTLASIGDAVIVANNEGQIIFLNEVAERLTGWPAAEAIGRPCATVFSIVNEETRQVVESPVDRVLRLGTVVGLANHTLLIAKHGGELPIDDSGAPIREPGGVVLVFRDFSEHKATERELIAAKESAEAANHAKDNFLASLSHELRSPLTPVLAMLMTWEADPELPASMSPAVHMLRRNIELEALLIDDLLDLTRISRGKVSLNLENVDVHQLVESVMESHRSEFNGKRLATDVTLDAPHYHAEADSARLQQVFGNIVNNALKFTGEGGHISVASSNREDGCLVINFADDGIGMTPDTMARVFLPFEQGREDVVRKAGGLGLGMAISKTLVNALGGELTASSLGPGQGATFSVVLPTSAPGDGKRPQVQNAALDGSAERHESILFVEDQADSAEVLSMVLRNMGFEVRSCATVAEATRVASENHFDLLLSDVGLGDGTGIDLIREIRRHSSYPAIALTGFGMEQDIERFKQEGFDAHLTKPVNLEKLEATIRSLLTRESRPS